MPDYISQMLNLLHQSKIINKAIYKHN